MRIGIGWKVVLACGWWLAIAHGAVAQSLVVNTTAGGPGSAQACRDGGTCTLVAAVTAANATDGADAITFAIPANDPGCDAPTGVCRIALQQSLFVGRPLSIDGYTQAGASANTRPSPEPLDSVLKIEIRPATGAGAPSSALVFSSFPGLYTVTGIAFAAFRDESIGGEACAGTRYRILGNYIGTDASGSVALGAGSQNQGIEIGSCTAGGSGAVEIGGGQPADRNLVVAVDGTTAVQLSTSGLSHYEATIRGNVIGLDRSLTSALSNGIGISASLGLHNLTNRLLRIGGPSAADGNVIAGNRGDAIQLFGNCAGGVRGCAVVSNNWIGRTPVAVFPNGGVAAALGGGAIFGAPGEGNVVEGNGGGVRYASSASPITVSSNRMRGNVGLGLTDLSGQRTVNDPGDADAAGANQGQNFPEISAYAVVGGNVQLAYRVDAAPANSAYPLRVEFFKADRDEGAALIGADSYAVGEAGQVKNIVLPVPVGVTLGPDDVVVATATDAEGRSSQFSWHPLSLTIVGTDPSASPAGTAYAVRMRAVALAGPFRPGGTLRVVDGAGGSCVTELAPVAAALTSEGTCNLMTGGSPRTITLTATYDTLSGAFGSASGSNAAATGPHQIAPPPPERVSFLTCVRSENERAGTVTLVVTRQGGADVSVRVEHVGGTATLGADYSPPPDATLTWIGTDMSPRNVVVQLVNDTAVEPQFETVDFRLVNPLGTEIAPLATTQLRIYDDDAEPDVHFRDGFEGDACPVPPPG